MSIDGEKLGLPDEVIRPAPDTKAPIASGTTARQMVWKPGDRSIRAMLFGDIKWFRKLSEPQMPIFTREVVGLFARVLGRHGRKILFRNTWGDGLLVTIADVETAASVAIELQEAMAAFDFKRVGLPDLALRLGTHLGPGVSTARPGPETHVLHGSSRL